MSTKIVVLFNLKDGVSAADYEAWAKATDLPTVNGLKSVDSFQPFRSVGLLGSDAKPPYAYVEIIDVNDMDTFGDEIGTDAMQKVASEFQSMVDDVFFILTEPVR
ncbi:REDY-like protein HapK [Parvularcula lutaonensis]|uniref:REDY-like protein HapK n=1 Tax=Parvularcula lutaonensis TaxID=491923 RepID=A0ABV7MB00_9PROT|nr:REDY-like protein HapK [Parvularcula lutaonensis]GGY38579.1 hypothetical protein GCM10007148_03620 [Parvularcula lutaonensis]